MSVSPNTPMVRQDLIDLVTAANGKSTVLHTPFTLYFPQPSDVINDRGGFTPGGVYNALDKVNDGYDWIATANGVTLPPRDATTGNPNTGWAQAWNVCYQRLRDEVSAAAHLPIIGVPTLANFQQAVSGPWPITNPDINYDQQAFYYEDTGNTESVALAGTVNNQSQIGDVTLADATIPVSTNFPYLVDIETNITFDDMSGPFDFGTEVDTANTNIGAEFNGKVRWISEGTFEVEIGGSVPMTVDLTFVVSCPAIRGALIHRDPVAGPRPGGDGTTDTITYATTDPTTLITIDTTNWFGASFTQSASSWVAPGSFGGGFLFLETATVTCTCHVTGTVSPGTYRVSFSTSAVPNYRASGDLTTLNYPDPDGSSVDTQITGFNEWQFDTFIGIGPSLSVAGTMGLTNSTSVTVPGIDDTKAIKKIALPTFSTGGFPSGVTCVGNLYRYTLAGVDNTLSILDSPGRPIGGGPATVDVSAVGAPDPGFVLKQYLPATGWSITSSVNGYWFGKTPPISSLGIRPYDRMQWNKFPIDPVSGDAQTNTYLGYKLPYVGGFVQNSQAARAYDTADSPSWMPSSNDMELLTWPKRWKPNTHYPVGWSIIDSYGNFQTVTIEGRSAATEPTWPVTLNATTQEPTFHGALSRTEAGVKWVLNAVMRAAPTRQALTAYAIGKTAIDGNGNVVTSITTWTGLTGYTGVVLTDSNGNQQTVQTNGTSGAAEPTWSKVLNGLTTDGSVVWKLTQLNATPPVTGTGAPTWPTTLGGTVMDGTVRWKLTTINPKITPAVARITPPIYPVFWQNPVSDWVAKASQVVGNTITDTAGNTQQVVTGGVAGATAPTWNTTTLGGQTTDGTIVWKLIRLEQPLLTMPTTNGSPQFHHIYDFQTPTSERVAAGVGDGFWIYRVAINRMGKKQNLGVPPTGAVSVTLGCMRSGSFVAFGTYNTGQFIDAMWPVFTNTALCYQASERVDIQAEFITCGISYSTWGAIDFPMCAAYLNDMINILALLS